MKKDLLTLLDLSAEEINIIIQRAKVLKEDLRACRHHFTLQGKTMAMIFKKPSTRTRISFQAGFFQMGGLAFDLNREFLQMERGESLQDTAKVFSRYVDIIVIRTFKHEEVEAIARFSTIPVINGLTDLYHPCQILSDIFTIKEYKGMISGIKVSYIGDGNNIANSWINAASVMGLDLRLSSPRGYEPKREILENGQSLACKLGGRIDFFEDPRDAVLDADVIYTDVWVSMGQEEDRDEKRKKFSNYQVNQRLLNMASPHVLVMHCLPAHRGEEITEEVIDGPNSIVFDQAENRLHVQKAIVESLIIKGQI